MCGRGEWVALRCVAYSSKSSLCASMSSSLYCSSTARSCSLFGIEPKLEGVSSLAGGGPRLVCACTAERECRGSVCQCSDDAALVLSNPVLD